MEQTPITPDSTTVAPRAKRDVAGAIKKVKDRVKTFPAMKGKMSDAISAFKKVKEKPSFAGGVAPSLDNK